MSLRRALPLTIVWLAFAFCAGEVNAQVNPQRTRNPHGRLDVACQNCHASDSWKPIRRAPDFNHNNQTAFPLTGQHASLGCTSCHVKPVFADIGQTCASCHADIHRRQFGASCENCHTVRGWKVQIDSVQRHANRFPLVGAHAVADCESCHRGAASGAFTGLSTACLSCHASDYQGARTVDHRAAGFSTVCESCHSLTQWRGARFDHSTATRFPLRGAHSSVQCLSCHTNGNFQGTAADCFSCHASNFNQTTNPSHRSSGFPTDCQSCHTDAGWKGAQFNHSVTRFPLTGAHAVATCQQCHVGGQFTGTSQACVSCHSNQYEATTTPNHMGAGFSRECFSCHTTSSWRGAQFDHSRTRFPLTGAHTATACASCHTNNTYSGTPAECASCHSKQFDATRNPSHTASGFPRTCASCHTTTAWTGARFDHNALTRFPLTGAHINTTCTTCHVNGQFAGTPQTCIGCHATNYSRTTNPNHVTAGFPQDCALCHSTTTWAGARFDHNSKTRFPLTGSHVNVSCVQCHAGNRFAGTPQDCTSCHGPLYDKTTNPNHLAAAFPRDCALCHATSAWKPAAFDHARTRFPLTGAHTSATCASCHSSGRYAGLNTTCVSCHVNQYNSTTAPNHVSAGFPQDCQLCHSTTQWRGATFDHSRTRFALTGKHTTVQCASCHIGGRYAGTPTDCYSCHSREYTTVTNPNHVAAGFPRTCETCHTTTTWIGAKVTHKFPIYSGAHAGKWSTCTDCHTNSSNYTVFSCLNCHEHERSKMDDKHKEIRGYVYDSLSCYGCHPSGKH